MTRKAQPQARFLAILAAAAGVLPLAACGGSEPDMAKGKQLFTQKCGSCHELADAGSRGTIGPSLDDAFRQSIADGLGRGTIEGVVLKQIDLPQGGEMPADLVTGDDAEAVAAYVADVAAKPGSGSTGTTGPAGGGKTARANAKNEVEIPADPGGQLLFAASSASAKAGKVTLLSKNASQVPHDISIKGGGVEEKGNQVTGGGTSRVTADLKPGRYTFYCSLPGHEQGGMTGPLTVE